MRIFGIIIGLIFGLVFASAGFYFLNQTSLPTYQSWQGAKQWQSVLGELISVEGHSNDTTATYVYYVDSHRYQNDRVYISRFKDNIGSYHKDMYRKLAQIRNAREPVTIWYDPQNPQQSVIDREMRWGLFALMTGFCSVFILIGVGVCCASFFSKTQNRDSFPSGLQPRREWQQKRGDPQYQESYFDFVRHKRQELAKQSKLKDSKISSDQSAPWLGKKEWAGNHIRSGAKKSMILTWAFTIVWNAISSPLLFAFAEEWEKGNIAILLALLFPLVGVFLLVKAIQATREWLRFGVLEVVLDPFPGSIGGHVGGSLAIGNRYEHDAHYKVELECVYSYVSGSGENISRKEDIRWGEGGAAKLLSTGHGISLLFRFDVPDNLPEADIEQSEAYYFWRLKFASDLRGADLNREYNIPVFKTGEHSSHVSYDNSKQAQRAREQQAEKSQIALDRGELHETALARSLRFKKKGNALLFYFPMFRNKALTIFLLIFAGGFGFAAYSMFNGFSGGDIFGSVITIFSIPFALVAVVTGIAAVYLPLNNLSVSIARGKLKAVRRLFVFPIRYNVVGSGEINNLQIKKSGSTGQGSKKIEHFKVLANVSNYKSITIAEDIDGKDLANQLKEFISKHLLLRN